MGHTVIKPQRPYDGKPKELMRDDPRRIIIRVSSSVFPCSNLSSVMQVELRGDGSKYNDLIYCLMKNKEGYYNLVLYIRVSPTPKLIIIISAFCITIFTYHSNTAQPTSCALYFQSTLPTMRYSIAFIAALAAIASGVGAGTIPIAPTADEIVATSKAHPSSTRGSPVHGYSVHYGGQRSKTVHLQTIDKSNHNTEREARVEDEIKTINRHTRTSCSVQPAHTSTAKSSKSSSATSTAHPAHTMVVASRSLHL